MYEINEGLCFMVHGLFHSFIVSFLVSLIVGPLSNMVYGMV